MRWLLFAMPGAIFLTLAAAAAGYALPTGIALPNFSDEAAAQPAGSPRIVEADVSIFFDPQPEVIGTYSARGKSGLWKMDICSPVARIDAAGNVQQIDVVSAEWKRWLSRVGSRVVATLANSPEMPEPGLVNVTIQNQKQTSSIQFTPDKENAKADLVTQAVRSAMNLDKVPLLSDALPSTEKDTEALLLKLRLYKANSN